MCQGTNPREENNMARKTKHTVNITLDSTRNVWLIERMFMDFDGSTYTEYRPYETKTVKAGENKEEIMNFFKGFMGMNRRTLRDGYPESDCNETINHMQAQCVIYDDHEEYSFSAASKSWSFQINGRLIPPAMPEELASLLEEERKTI